MANILGWVRRKKDRTHTRIPTRIPEDPKPAIALPAMNAAELGAVADTMDPTPRIPTAITRIHFTRN